MKVQNAECIAWLLLVHLPCLYTLSHVFPSPLQYQLGQQVTGAGGGSVNGFIVAIRPEVPGETSGPGVIEIASKPLATRMQGPAAESVNPDPNAPVNMTPVQTSNVGKVRVCVGMLFCRWARCAGEGLHPLIFHDLALFLLTVSSWPSGGRSRRRWREWRHRQDCSKHSGHGHGAGDDLHRRYLAAVAAKHGAADWFLARILSFSH
jgi:hypothetical protein